MPRRSNILHFTADNKDYATSGSRMPALYLAANSSTLVFTVGKQVFNLTAIPLGKETLVSIKAFDENRFRVSFDRKEKSVFEPSWNRTYGAARLYLGNPWEDAANVTVSNLRMFTREGYRWLGSNSTFVKGAVLTEEPVPLWSYQETASLARILLANGYNLTDKVVCHNRSINGQNVHLKTVPSSSSFVVQCLDGHFDRLTMRGLKTLPESIGDFSNLRILVIYSGQLGSLPDAIGKLSSLTGLSVHQNQLKFVPESIGNLTKLNVLYVNLTKVVAGQQSATRNSKMAG